MELCGEPDIFIGRRTNKFRRYSGLLEQPVTLEDHKKVRHISGRRVTINSFESKSKKISFNDILTSCEDNKRFKTSVKIESTTTYENDSLAAGGNKNKKNTRNNRRSTRDSFGLNCTFIKDKKGNPPAKLDHQKLPHGGRYSLRSSFGITDCGLEKNNDFVTLRKMNQFLHTKLKRSVEAVEENTNSPPEDKKNYSGEKKSGEERKYFSPNCTFIEDIEGNQSSEFAKQQKISPHSGRRYSLRSSSGGFESSWKRNPDFVAVREALDTFPIKKGKTIGVTYEELHGNTGVNNQEVQSTNGDLSTKDVNSSVQMNKGLNKGKNGRERTSCGSNYKLLKHTQNNSPELKNQRVHKKKRVNQRKPVDMNRTFNEDTDENKISHKIFHSYKCYSLGSSLGACENNLNKHENLAKINEESDFIRTEPTKNVNERVVQKNHEKLLVLQFDKTLEGKPDEFHNNSALPVTQEDKSPVQFNSSTTPICGRDCCHSNRFLKEIDTTLTQSCELDKGSFSISIDQFDNVINNEKVFVIDRGTNECRGIFFSNNVKKLNDNDEEIEVCLPTQNNGTRNFEKIIELADCIFSLDMKTSTVTNDNFSRADIKEGEFRNKPEKNSCLVENWIMSHFHLDSKVQFNKICPSKKTTTREPPDLKNSFINFTSQQENNTSESANIDQQIFQTDIQLLKSSSEGGGRKKDDESAKQKISNKKKTTKKCSNLETIFENPEKRLMSSRRFKRSINFDNFSSFARVRRRKLKAKKINSFQSRNIVDTSKLDAILDNLSMSD